MATSRAREIAAELFDEGYSDKAMAEKAIQQFASETAERLDAFAEERRAGKKLDWNEAWAFTKAKRLILDAAGITEGKDERK